MSGDTLNQAEADALLAMAKIWVDDVPYMYPQGGGSISVPLQSQDGLERFVLDIYRGRINLDKVTYQNRARHVISLARLDLNGPSHRNPDGEELPCPHLHLYREGYSDKWASPVPQRLFKTLGDLWATLNDFMGYCNIVEPPNIERGLFS
jgi:MoaA/NifB/PqqE/SkfB family radical SAM enzyme